MKVAFSVTGRAMDAVLDPRFGRCSTFLLVEPDDMSFEAVDSSNSSHGGGAAIQTAQLVAHKGVKAVLPGSCGPNVHQTLSAVGIDVIEGCRGNASEVVVRFKASQLKPTTAPNVTSHSGMGGGGR